MLFLDMPFNEVQDLGHRVKKVKYIYTHFTEIDYEKYKDLTHVLCPCTNIEHLQPQDHPEIKYLYLDNAWELYKNVVSSAEWVVTHIFELLKHNKSSSDEIKGKTIGFIGYGRMMQRVAKMLSGCDINMYYFDIKEPEFYKSSNVTRMFKLNAILEKCDIICVGLKETTMTKNFIGDFEFSQMYKKPYFLNNSRSSIVNGPALIRAIKQHKIKGCAIDVFESYDKSIILELYKLAYGSYNFKITPHIAGKGQMSRCVTDTIIFEKFKEVLNEEKQ